MAFGLSVKLSLSQPMSFLIYPSDSLPHSIRGSDQAAVWCSVAHCG